MQAAAARLVPLIRTEAPKIERLGAMTPDMLQALDDIGIFKMAMPPELGGSALGARDVVEVVSTLARGDGSVAWMAFVAAGMRMVSMYPQQLIDDISAKRDTWVGPLCIGASVFSTVVGNARKVDGGWMVSGKWAFGSGSKHANWASVGIQFETEHGPGRAMAILPMEELKILDDWQVMGLSGTASNSIATEAEVFVPAHRVIDMRDLDGIMGSASHRYSGLAFKTSTRAAVLTISIYTVSIALGMAQGALECFVEQARKLRPFNLPYPTVADMPTVQVAAAKARAMVNLAATVIRDHAAEIDRRSLAGEDFSPTEEPELTLDLVYAARLCEEATNNLQIALGSSTARLSNPIQRFVRDIRVLTSHGALRLEPLSEINGRHMLGLEPFSMFAGGLAKVGG
jgi:alkylation response protein AidB-like acyl-CoA dehydrogenase